MKPRIGLALVLGAVLLAGSLGPRGANAQSLGAVLWTEVGPSSVTPIGQRDVVPLQYRVFAVDAEALELALASAPPLGSSQSTALVLPLPDGSREIFEVQDSPVMEPELAARHPRLRTQTARGVDEPSATGRMDWTQQGFHALIHHPQGTFYIDPYQRGDTRHYIAYFKRDFASRWSFLEFAAPRWPANPRGPGLTAQGPAPAPFGVPGPAGARAVGTPTGGTLYTYRLAVAATGEYTAFHGTAADAQAAIVTAVNRINEVYERDIAVHMNLVANNDLVVYDNASTDPYTNNDAFSLLTENQANLDSVIGSANYDIGHVFSTAGGGLAYGGVICHPWYKAFGETGRNDPIGDPFYIDYVAHEVGHQFSANHTFNGTTFSCGGGNRSAATAFEPGSGTTIMAYAGICSTENVQFNSDDHFHPGSLDEMNAHIAGSGGTCAVLSGTGNSPPTVTPGQGLVTLPVNTPFALTGNATDIDVADRNTLTYEWSQVDLGTASPPNTDDGSRPIFRSFSPSLDPTRVFPQPSDLLAGTQTLGEFLPTTSRTLTFRLTVRDNRPGFGGVSGDDITVQTTTSAGPFVVQSPNTAISVNGQSNLTVSWNVAGTSAPPVQCTTVDIDFSSDGGNSFTQNLATATPNDGAHTVTLPNTSTTSARIRVQCSLSTTVAFFDLSDADFSITQVTVVGDDDDDTSGDDDAVGGDDDDTSGDDDTGGDDDDTVTLDADEDGVVAGTDCDDNDPNNYPGNTEVCDGLDNDCNGVPSFDASGEVDWDGDGSISCLDCDDYDAAAYPGNPEVCDGFDNDCVVGTFADVAGEVDVDGDMSFSCADCDDSDAAVSPELPEACDTLDTDCDPSTDELTDGDGDGLSVCDGDCDDGDADRAPGLDEVCDTQDNDCSEATDEDVDADGDDYTICEGDCNDSKGAVRPGVAELCDGYDTDCDGLLPDEEVDGDGDGESPCAGDCDDSDADRFGSAAEICDGIDQDCDGLISDEFDDTDSDGVPDCEDPDDDGDGSLDAEDCGPTDSSVYPGAVEVSCDGVDSDCGGEVEDTTDGDGDGWSVCEGDCNDVSSLVHPEAAETCTDPQDLDCDGRAGSEGDCAEAGCGCVESASSARPGLDAIALVFGLFLLGGRRRRLFRPGG